MIMLKVKKTHPNAVIHARKHDDDAGMDLSTVEIVDYLSSQVVLYDTGISVQSPEGYYTEVIPRSSTSKMGISLANGTGVIDPSYTGSIKLAIRFNESLHTPKELVGRRLAQLLIKPLHVMEVVEVDELNETTRGSGGFGSTGK